MFPFEPGGERNVKWSVNLRPWNLLTSMRQQYLLYFGLRFVTTSTCSRGFKCTSSEKGEATLKQGHITSLPKLIADPVFILIGSVP